jgi:hypothetical protein
LWSGYLPTSALPTSAQDSLVWQVGQHPWLPLAVADALDLPAVGEDRGNMWLALDATASSGDSMNASAIADLRLISLSLDLPYQQEPQQIFPVPSDAAFHYVGQMGATGSGSAIRYTVEGYDDEAQHATSIAISRNGEPYYTDVARDQEGIRLDPATRTYQQRAPTDLTPAAPPRSATQIFFSANTLAQSGFLWNAGPTTYNSASVYLFLLVDAPSPTRIYVDQRSQQVVAVVVDASSTTHPGGADAVSPFVGSNGCPSYTLIEVAQPSQLPAFATTPPAGYTRGQVPSTLTC